MNTRKDNNGKAMKAWMKLGPGHIAKPLRHIGYRTNGADASGKIVLSAEYKKARRLAKTGDGLAVAKIALSLA